MRTVYATTPHRLRRGKSRRRTIVSWRPWVASPFSLPVGETDAPAPGRAKEWAWERGRVSDNLRLIDAVGAHPSPPAFARLRRGRQSSPLQQGERQDKSVDIQTDNQQTLRRRGNRVRFVLPWRAKKGQHASASSSLGVSRELHLILFPQGQPRPGLMSQN